ncbi:putative plant lipid transfer protein/Par allergen [Helianthus annuus]|uniref:Plant lipid transfer protein/Par allergen n=2 Tax=Helianthus annuus TaxID=4232 RepID=A0A9K3H9X5_HELAN|nr:putative plant lipid transfer protein/Par allergen [Helianthus annuus]KAJ0475999.1 putative plant non-specific lipid-transfer protein/Par allergen [Helianthus annuus]KAJ0480049.1 putative plant lipid transfer protein/Par allergen [Helianthus annuus]KAJ0496804.1 putative plant non-specific lipid-transfer protein/Par allergen [Helianthus annuus]KAJ0662837.1 putative plant non-specific lipid-transfer protein/Par allergen [Helianthus annuus]
MTHTLLHSQKSPIMACLKAVTGGWLLVVTMFWVASKSKTSASVDCVTVTTLISTCSAFVTYGSPDPYPGSPCCDAVSSLNNLGDSEENKRALCMCMMGVITTYNPNATAIATLPGFCGVSLGFTIDPNTDCN